MIDTARIRAYLFAGDATFTVRSVRSGQRYTFRVRRKEPTPDRPRPAWWVYVLSGSDNTSDYSYIGSVTPEGRAYPPRGREPAPSWAAFEWLIRQVFAGPALPPTVEFWHSGACARCGRELTTPESIEAGLGPKCRERS
jgi:hypothetical protein